MAGSADAPADLKQTPLHALHVELGARMVPFAGYDMPVQYPDGILAEHRHTRSAAGLFDVSHMGQARLVGADPAAALERLVPGDIAGLAPGKMRYTLLLTDEGGIIDDLMVTRPREGSDTLQLVVNAACKEGDFAHIAAALDGVATLHRDEDRALLALQGPQAVAALARLAPDCAGLSFMQGAAMTVGGYDCFVTRSGYTGEDGFEISVPKHGADALARRLLDEADVAPIGLGARDSLRLEAGLCLYGHDIDTETTPIEAALAWTVPKSRRERADFPGAERILAQLADGTTRRRVGILPEGRAPAREGAEITDAGGEQVGSITSGGFSPTLERPIAMGYVRRDLAKADTPLVLMVRNKPIAARTAKLPFVAPNYHRD